jgi:hypothetical protein
MGNVDIPENHQPPPARIVSLTEQLDEMRDMCQRVDEDYHRERFRAQKAERRANVAERKLDAIRKALE